MKETMGCHKRKNYLMRLPVETIVIYWSKQRKRSGFAPYCILQNYSYSAVLLLVVVLIVI
jgi:hypothetical protein